MEIRLHGRGGQGGVTGAKILASLYGRLGKSVQAFGDYAGERSGAPVRAFTRVSDTRIENRNKVYAPDHLLVLDRSLLTDETVSGLAPGGILLVNSPHPPERYAERYPGFQVATVDATAIARRHKIGTRSLVIVNTTIAGSFARLMGFTLDNVQEVYEEMGLASSNIEAAREAYEAVVEAKTTANGSVARKSVLAGDARVLPLTDHQEGLPTGLRTGSWRTQIPRYLTALAPCSAQCPAGNDVVGFLQALEKEGVDSAARILARSTPLPGVCGRVCPGFCMEGCNRRAFDGAVNIRALERWIADHVDDSMLGEPCKAAQRRRVAIVGSGPAGLAAAYVLTQAGHEATLFEGEKELGGVLRTGIPVYRLPRDVLAREIGRIMAMGVKAEKGQFLDGQRLVALAKEFDAVILATGMQKLRGLKIPGEELKGVEQGIDFLHRQNMSDRISKVSGHVVVLGGGNTALDCARTALRCGASKVTIAYRRTRAEMPAIAEEVEEAIEEGVELLLQRAPMAFLGSDSVEAIELADVEMGPPDESGRRRPVVTSRVNQLACDLVLLALGQSAELAILPKGWQLREGRMWEGEAALNVFAAGDVATGEGTVTHAIGDGRRAAGLALEALGEAVDVFERPDPSGAVTPEQVCFSHFDPAEPAKTRHAPANERIHHFEEVNQGLADPGEAGRCFSCGVCTECDTCLIYCPDGVIMRQRGGGYTVDEAYCKGCGVCVAECPRGAMTMETP